MRCTAQWRRRKPLRMIGRLATATLSLALAALSIAWYAVDRQARGPAAAFVRDFTLAERRPADARRVIASLTADRAAEPAGDAALQDALGSTPLTDVAPEQRALWIESLTKLDGELATARALLLDSIASRPGWPDTIALLGMVEYAADERTMTQGRHSRRWLRTMRTAAEATPDNVEVSTFAARALLASWLLLDDGARGELGRFYRPASTDPAFVRDTYLFVTDSIGYAKAEALLAPEPRTLQAAASELARDGAVEPASRLLRLWEAREWRARIMDARDLEARAARGDVAGVQRAAAAFVRRHPPRDFDTPDGQKQAARILELWPSEGGRWGRDPRTDLIRYFLDDRARKVDGEALERNTSQLDGAPALVSARAALRAGDFYAADARLRESDGAGSFEWTPYYVDLALAQAARRNAAAAREALDGAAPAARDECDVIAAARIVDPSARPDRVVTVYTPEFWSRTALQLCVDPTLQLTKLHVELDAAAPALVSFSFQQGRIATRLLPQGRTAVELPLGGRFGRVRFDATPISGGALTPVVARLE